MPFGNRALQRKKSSKQEKFYNSPYRYFFNQSSVHTHCSGLDSRVLRSLKKRKETTTEKACCTNYTMSNAEAINPYSIFLFFICVLIGPLLDYLTNTINWQPRKLKWLCSFDRGESSYKTILQTNISCKF